MSMLCFDDINIDMDKKIIRFKIFDDEYLIPSEYFPLVNKNIKMLCYDNTKNIKNKKIEKIFNKQNKQLGRCYTNTEQLYNDLIKNHVSRYDLNIYVGWLFIGSTIPIYHCLLVYKDCYVLDLSDNIIDILNNNKSCRNISIEVARKKVADLYNNNKKKNNSEICTFGKMSKSMFFLGCQATSEDGKKLYRKLIKKYPNHICLNETDEFGRTKAQKMIIENNQ